MSRSIPWRLWVRAPRILISVGARTTGLLFFSFARALSFVSIPGPGGEGEAGADGGAALADVDAAGFVTLLLFFVDDAVFADAVFSADAVFFDDVAFADAVFFDAVFFDDVVFVDAFADDVFADAALFALFFLRRVAAPPPPEPSPSPPLIARTRPGRGRG